jgi:hypothetical protein
MALDSKNRWVVLLNKSPKGPLSKEEIDELLQKNVLRRNDIAYLLPPEENAKAPTEWKLLWQFPEFDRRGEESPAVVDRRQTPVQAVKKATEKFPQELLNISPADLVLHSRRPEENPEAPLPAAPSAPDSISFFPFFWRVAAVGVGIGGLFLVGAFVRPLRELMAPPVTALQKEGDLPSARLPAASPVPSFQPRVPRTAAAPPAPARREERVPSQADLGPELDPVPDSGEIPFPDEIEEKPGTEEKKRYAQKSKRTLQARKPSAAQEEERDSEESAASDPESSEEEPLSDWED